MRAYMASSLTLAFVLLTPNMAYPAKCKVNGEWYPYESPTCRNRVTHGQTSPVPERPNESNRVKPTKSTVDIVDDSYRGTRSWGSIQHLRERAAAAAADCDVSAAASLVDMVDDSFRGTRSWGSGLHIEERAAATAAARAVARDCGK
jgi:hypothetical protein